MTKLPAEADAICDRLEAAYRTRFGQIEGGFSAWVNPTQIGVEALFGGRVGPVWGTSVNFAKRRWPFGPVVTLMTLDEAEAKIRKEIEAYLISKEHP
jgi:hypothetical protein